MSPQSYLSISVGDESALVQYVSGSDVLVSHTHNHGLKHLESNAMNAQSVSKFLDNIIYSLEYISLYDRIPTDFRLLTPRYATWLKSVIEKASYAQFYTDGIPVRVTIENNKDVSLNYARHKKTLLSFKI